MNINISFNALIVRMACIVGVLFVLLATTAQGVGYQIQDNVSGTDSSVIIQINTMATNCQNRNGKVPTISSFIFNFWEAGDCYRTAGISQYPSLFNAILNALRNRQPLRYTLPDLSCTEQPFPNTISINYECATHYQLPIVVDPTSTTPTTTTTTTPSTTTTTTTTTITTTTTPTTTTTRTTRTTPASTTTATRTTTTTPTTTATTTTTPTTTTPTITTTRTTKTTPTATTTTTTPSTTSRRTTTATTRHQSASRTIQHQTTTAPIRTRRTSATSFSATTQRGTTPSPPTTGLLTENQLEAVSLAEYPGSLAVDLDEVVCQKISNLRVKIFQAQNDEGRTCLQHGITARAIEELFHMNISLIAKPECSDLSGRVSRLIIYYECLEDPTDPPPIITTPIITTPTTVIRNGTTPGDGAVDMKLGDTDRDTKEDDLPLILGIAIPIALLIILIPLIVFIVYRRRNKMKPLLGGRNNIYGTDEQVSRDPNQAFHYSQMNSAYSNENLDDDALYQDPAIFVKPRANGKHQHSVKSTDSDYQDPSSLACTGPPGTPSPIRDALYSNHEDPSSSSEIYADVDGLRGDPDGKMSTIPRTEGHVYDMPYLEVAKPVPPPRNLNNQYNGADHGGDESENRQSMPSYTHMIVTDGHIEPHNYAIIRKSRPVTESMYYELENEVQLYDSPVYNSREDLQANTDNEEDNRGDNS